MADVLTLTPGGHLFAGTWEELQECARAKCAACGMLVKDSGELLHRRPEGEGDTPEAERCTGWGPAVRFDVLGMIVRGIVREAPDDQPNGPLECAIEEVHEAHLRMLDVVLPLTQAHPEAHGALCVCGDAIADLTSLLADQARALELASGPAVLPGAIVQADGDALLAAIKDERRTHAAALAAVQAHASTVEEERDQAKDLLSRLAATWAGGGNPDDMRRLAVEAEALIGVQPEERPTC